jgi:hypothetical protein
MKQTRNKTGANGEEVAVTLLGVLAAREPDGVLRVPIEEIDAFMSAEHTIEIQHEAGNGPYEIVAKAVEGLNLPSN